MKKRLKIDYSWKLINQFYIREDDGTPTGDVSKEPIALFYSKEKAEWFVEQYNVWGVV